MIDRNESLRDKIATIVQAGYSERKTSVETADEIIRKISFLSILTRLERENAELRADKARLDWLADPKNTIGNVMLPREYIMNNLDCMRSAIDAAMKETK
jgi:hypothetical protein